MFFAEVYVFYVGDLKEEEVRLMNVWNNATINDQK